MSDDEYREALAYCAGFFDGEGCIHIERFQDNRHLHPQYALRLELANTDTRPLQLFKDLFGGSIRKRKEPRPEKWSTAWVWQIKTNMAKIFLDELMPFLVTKKEEARLGLEFREKCVKYNGRKLTKGEIDKREKYYWEMRGLKKRDNN